MRSLLLIVLVALAVVPARVGAQEASGPDRVARWSEDLDVLLKELPAKHKNAFFKCKEDAWRARGDEIRSKLGGLRDEQIFVELRRLVAMLGDGHTQLWTSREAKIPPQRAYPIAFAWLKDGVFAPAVLKEHEGVIGQRLVRIDGLLIEDAIARVSEVRAFDNESGRRHGAMQDLRDVDTLTHLGIVKDQAAATFVFAAADGKETSITLAPAPGDISKLITQRPDPATFPAWRSLRRFPYGHEMLDDSGTFYIWYDTCSNHPDKPVSAFIEETIKVLDGASARKTGAPKRVVIDFRRNGGGNSALFMPMIVHLASREWLKQPGTLYGLIGRRTFSSGMMNAYQLRNATKCKLVGEPTGGSPNGYGEIRSFPLPHSRLTVQYSTKLFRGVDEDTDAIYPDIAIETDSTAFFAGRDMVLERVTQDTP